MKVWPCHSLPPVQTIRSNIDWSSVTVGQRNPCWPTFQTFQTPNRANEFQIAFHLICRPQLKWELIKPAPAFFGSFFCRCQKCLNVSRGKMREEKKKANESSAVISNQHFVHSHNVILKVRGSEPKVVICKNLKLHPSLLANRL